MNANININEEKDKKEKEQEEKEKEDFIKILYNKIIEDNKKILNSISILSFFIEAAYIFKTEFKKINDKIIIDYIFQLINHNNKYITVDESIHSEIKKILTEDEVNTKDYNHRNVNNYFFENSKELCNFLINAYSSYLIHMHMRF